MWIVLVLGAVWVAGSSYFLFFKKGSEKKAIKEPATTESIKGSIAPRVNLVLDEDVAFSAPYITDLTIRLSDLMSGNYSINQDFIKKREKEEMVESILLYQEKEPEEPDFNNVPDIPDFDSDRTEEEHPNFEFDDSSI